MAWKEDAREIHLKHQGVKGINICKNCSLPRKTERQSTNIRGRTVSIDNYINRSQTIGE